MPSIWWLVLLVLNLAFRVPAVGRPRDHFIGAVGHRIEVRMRVDRTDLRVEEPLTLWVGIRGAWNPSQVSRPDLRRIPDFESNFCIDDLDLPRGNGSVREFGFRLRPRSASVREIPPILIRYWDPVLRFFPATAPHESIALNVQSSATMKPTESPQHEPEFLLQPCDVDDLERDQSPRRLEVVGMCLALFGPLSVGLVWLAVGHWRQRPRWRGEVNPWHEAVGQLRRLRRSALPPRDAAAHIDRILHEGLARWGRSSDMSLSHVTPRLHELSPAPASTTSLDLPWMHPSPPGQSAEHGREQLAAAAMSLLRRCERLRFGPPGTRDDSLLDDALRLVAHFAGESP
ncbi:MAG: hypothetical protein N2039_15840 [Gemmataceae bacterium]|nr:hypothetical protein [Gemmataceae bacterium]